jgi:hypothetical protein
MESQETELCNKLYKTEEQQQMYLGFQILQQEQQTKQNIFGFSNIKQKTASKANQS